MGPPVRQRHNAKARQSTVGGSSHKKRRTSRAQQDDENAPVQDSYDGNDDEMDMIVPGEKEMEREKRTQVSV